MTIWKKHITYKIVAVIYLHILNLRLRQSILLGNKLMLFLHHKEGSKLQSTFQYRS